MKEIPLTQGQIALVDDDDCEWLSKHKWFAHKHRNTFYVTRRAWVDGMWRHVKMHREILGLYRGDGNIVDHKNQNGLDCRRDNLRIATLSLNAYNCKKRVDNTSGYRGVTWFIHNKKWMTQLQIKGKRITSYHPDLISAAIAYDQAAIKYFGSDAILNFPERRNEYESISSAY